MNLNLDIDDYSDEDLYNLLELNDPSREEIIKKIEFLNINYFKDNETIADFFKKIEKRLLDNFNNNNYINEDIFKHFNYNIENHEYEYEYENENENKNKNEDEDEDEYEDEDEEDEEEDEKKNITESFSNYNEITTKDYDNSGNKIRVFYINKYLHFNTFFRQDKQQSSTNCDIFLPEITNVVQCKLIAINIRKPFLIHTTKFNNKFLIKKFNTANECDFSYNITIDNGYYNSSNQLVDFLNKNYFINSDISLTDISNTLFMKSITFSINENSKKIIFDLSSNYLQQNSNFNYFVLDFRSNYTPYYSLATIMGFNYQDLNNSITSINEESGNNLKITSPYEFNNLDTPLFFTFTNEQKLAIETQNLFLNFSRSTKDILAKINFSLANSNNNFYINEIFENADRKNNVRIYSNPINISNFNIKIVDIFDNIIESINEDFTFELEMKIKYTQIVDQSEST